MLSAAASSVPRAIALLRSRSSSRSAHIAASAQVAPPPVRLRHLCAALDAPRASARATKVHSTELVLSGVLLADMAGVMSDLADPLSQRVFLACAMLALGLPTTDTPVFVFAAPTPPPPLPLCVSGAAEAALAPTSPPRAAAGADLTGCPAALAPEPPCPAALVASSAQPALTAPGAPLAVSDPAGCAAQAWPQQQHYARFFRGTARPLAVALVAAEAAERTLSDVAAAGMWGGARLPPAGGGLPNVSSCMLIGTSTLSSQHVPLPLPPLLPAELLRVCADAAATGRFSDATVDAEVNAEVDATAAAAAGGPPLLLLRPLPGEALFILLTTSRRVATDAPAIVVQLLRAPASLMRVSAACGSPGVRVPVGFCSSCSRPAAAAPPARPLNCANTVQV